MALRLGRRAFLALAGAAAFVLPFRAPAADADDDIVVVDGWVLKRSDLGGGPAARRAVPLRTLL